MLTSSSPGTAKFCSGGGGACQKSRLFISSSSHTVKWFNDRYWQHVGDKIQDMHNNCDPWSEIEAKRIIEEQQGSCSLCHGRFITSGTLDKHMEKTWQNTFHTHLMHQNSGMKLDRDMSRTLTEQFMRHLTGTARFQMCCTEWQGPAWHWP